MKDFPKQKRNKDGLCGRGGIWIRWGTIFCARDRTDGRRGVADRLAGVVQTRDRELGAKSHLDHPYGAGGAL